MRAHGAAPAANTFCHRPAGALAPRHPRPGPVCSASGAGNGGGRHSRQRCLRGGRARGGGGSPSRSRSTPRRPQRPAPEQVGGCAAAATARLGPARQSPPPRRRGPGSPRGRGPLHRLPSLWPPAQRGGRGREAFVPAASAALLPSVLGVAALPEGRSVH